MEGSKVFKLGVKVLVDVIRETVESARMTLRDIDWLILHQANVRILSAVAKQLDIPVEKFIVSLDRHGNTSAASIPLALDEALRDGQIVRGHTLMLAAVGGGLTWGAALMKF